ncbi:MAG TPA: hypothetical protein VK464_11490, partial [Symbiobacteriaceae bacterium]|nr:hypothetical protein [Symbiobacteriaceae bacterium]
MLRVLSFILLLLMPVTAMAQAPGKIAFVRGGNLWLWENGRERQVTRTGDVANPQISPSGRYVAFEQGGRLLVTPAAGGDLWAVEPSGFARWAPAEDTLAVDIAAGVATVPVADQGPESPRLIAMGWHSPAWAPDGSALAVARGEPGNTMARGRVTLAVVARTGGQPRTVVTEQYDERSPAVGASPLAWSADGRWLAYGRYGRTASLSADY